MPKPAGRFRIACIGGSTTYTSDIEDYKKSYPHLLEKYLIEMGFKDLDVINAGANGWSSWESLINLELRVLDLDPDLIVIYHGVNDVHPRFVWPPETYTGDNSGYRIPPLSEIFMPSVFEHSTLLRMLMINAGITKPHSDFEATLDRHPETYYGVQFRKQKVNNSYPKGIFQEIDANRMLENNRPVYFERNIRNMVSVAKNWEIGVVISSFAFCPLFTEQPIASSEEYVASYKENNKLLEKIASEMDVNFIDFAAVMPNDKRYFTDGRHLNEEGVHLKAKLFGDFIIDKYLVTAGGN